jgi:uroporphyrinogen decarboxylase
MAETGTGGIDTLDPPPLGDVDLAEAKRRIGARLFIKGNIDPVNVVLGGTPADVRAAAERCLSEAMAGGGYVLSTACSVPPASPPANILEIRAAAEAAGRYAR